MPAAEPVTRQRAERLEARTTRENKNLCQRAAELEGRTLSDFVVNSAVEAAKRSIRETELLALTVRDRTAFVTALLGSAPAPNVRLRKAAERHQQILG